MGKTKLVTVRFLLEIEENGVDELKKAVDHHIEALLDLDGWPEIKSVSNAAVIEC